MSGSIVVGADGSAGSGAALRFAAEEARLRGARLRVVHAWRMPMSLLVSEPSALGTPLLPEVPLEELHASSLAQAEEVVAAALRDVDLDGLDVVREPVEGPPAQVLIEAAGDGDLLVVGSRGRGGFAGLLLGSVSQQCAQHAPCPVVIVPERARP